MTTAIWHNADGSVADTLKYAFDPNGNLTGASNNAGTYTIGYDALDRVWGEQEPFTGVLTMSYCH
jgi:YD repeat-containing protein